MAIGGVEQRKEQCRDARRIRLADEIRRDLGYTLRILRRAPAFATAAILTLALGIGATVAVFTVVNGVLLRPMPFPQPEQLFLVANSPQGPFITQPGLADSHFLALRKSGTAVSASRRILDLQGKSDRGWRSRRDSSRGL